MEGAHLFISLLSSQEKTLKTLVVSRRRRRRHLNEAKRRERAERLERQRTAAAARRLARLRVNETPTERSNRLARIWAPLSSSLLSNLAPTATQDVSSDAFTEPLPELFDPTAALSDEDMAKQLRNAIRLVHRCLHEGRGTRALAIARSMWDIWPESAPGGGTSEDAEEEEDEATRREKERALGMGLVPPNVVEFMALRKIFLLDLAGGFCTLAILINLCSCNACNAANQLVIRVTQ